MSGERRRGDVTSRGGGRGTWGIRGNLPAEVHLRYNLGDEKAGGAQISGPEPPAEERGRTKPPRREARAAGAP